MEKKTCSLILNLIGGFSLIGGILLGLWFLTVGLLCVLWSYATNKDASVFFLLVVGIIFSALLVRGGVGIRRRRPSARLLLILSYALALIPIIGYVFSEIWQGFSSHGFGSEFFDVWSWLGGIIFWTFMAVLVTLSIIFLNSNKTKELFENNEEESIK